MYPVSATKLSSRRHLYPLVSGYKLLVLDTCIWCKRGLRFYRATLMHSAVYAVVRCIFSLLNYLMPLQSVVKTDIP